MTSGNNPFTDFDGYDTYQPDFDKQEKVEVNNQDSFAQANHSADTDIKDPDVSTKSDGKNYIIDPLTGIKITEEDIRQREEYLREREMRINNINARSNAGDITAYPNNFPPLLKWYKYYPDKDLPSDSHIMVNRMLHIYYGGILLCLINVVCSFMTLAPNAASKVKSPATLIVTSLVFLFLVPYTMISLSFMNLYKSLKETRGLLYVIHMIVHSLTCIFFFFSALSIGSYGGLGWINSVNILSGGSKVVGAFGIIYSIAASLYFALLLYQLVIIARYFRAHEFDKKARAEVGRVALDAASRYSIEADHQEGLNVKDNLILT